LRLLVVGKIASVTHWLEECATAWRAEGHEVAVVLAEHTYARRLAVLVATVRG
jgi:hypothetical protein